MRIFRGYGLAVSVVTVAVTAALLALPSRHSTAMAQTSPNAAANAADKNEIEHGRYLVEEVAKCAECHTPRNERGELRAEAWMKGASIWIEPVVPVQNWALNVPALAGWPSFTEEQGERILEKGTGPEGEELRPPMHIYHMNHADAKAIIAYLRTLPR